MGEVALSAVGGLVFFNTQTRLPREGGDPDPFAQFGRDPLPRHCEARRAEATQGIITSGPRQSPGLLRCARNDAGMGAWISPHPTLSPKGARARTEKPSPRGRGLGEGLLLLNTPNPPSPRRRGPRPFRSDGSWPATTSLRGPSRRSNPGDHQHRSAPVPWVASLRSQ